MLKNANTNSKQFETVGGTLGVTLNMSNIYLHEVSLGFVKNSKRVRRNLHDVIRSEYMIYPIYKMCA